MCKREVMRALKRNGSRQTLPRRSRMATLTGAFVAGMALAGCAAPGYHMRNPDDIGFCRKQSGDSRLKYTARFNNVRKHDFLLTGHLAIEVKAINDERITFQLAGRNGISAGGTYTLSPGRSKDVKTEDFEATFHLSTDNSLVVRFTRFKASVWESASR